MQAIHDVVIQIPLYKMIILFVLLTIPVLLSKPKYGIMLYYIGAFYSVFFMNRLRLEEALDSPAFFGGAFLICGVAIVVLIVWMIFFADMD